MDGNVPGLRFHILFERDLEMDKDASEKLIRYFVCKDNEFGEDDGFTSLEKAMDFLKEYDCDSIEKRTWYDKETYDYQFADECEIIWEKEKMKPVNPILEEIDFQGMCLAFAGETGGFGALDDMDVLMNSYRFFDNQICSYDYASNSLIPCSNNHHDNTRASYISYMADALIYLYDGGHDSRITQFMEESEGYVAMNCTAKDYEKYILQYYGEEFVADAYYMRRALCQDIDFLVTAWEIIEAFGEEEGFKTYLSYLYHEGDFEKSQAFLEDMSSKTKSLDQLINNAKEKISEQSSIEPNSGKEHCVEEEDLPFC